MNVASSISAVVPAYQAERWIAEAIGSILRQTSPPDEVIVVDDGCTDGTADVVRGFGDAVRLVQQENRGLAAAYNRAFREAESDYVAMCPSDDIWEPRKLEWQQATLTAHPEVDVAFGGARFFGLDDREFLGPSQTGVLDSRAFLRDIYEVNRVPDPSTAVRRRLFEDLGGFREDLPAQDYEFWLRALSHGAIFFNDPRLLVCLRQHGDNASAQALAMWEMNLQLHQEFGPAIGDEDLVRRTLARDLRTLGRCRLGLGRTQDARRAFRESAHRSPHAATYAWTFALSLPGADAALSRVAARRRRR